MLEPQTVASPPQPEYLDLIDVFRLIRVACGKAGSQRAWAYQHGLSPQFVSDVLNAKCLPTDIILAAVGLARSGPPIWP